MRNKKLDDMDILYTYIHNLYRRPVLKRLFLELTMQCNANCFHCGSKCTPDKRKELSAREFKRVLDEVNDDFNINDIQLCITGGEPLLRRDFFEIMSYANHLGYKWGMTSNGMLITKEVAKKLAMCGMRTISVSIDGMPSTHDKLRGTQDGYIRAMTGIQNLINVRAFENVQVTTVINHKNIDELDKLFVIMDSIDIDSWRIINLEPIGRALDHPDLMCTKEDYQRLFSFIREKRKQGYPICYGCSHYLGTELEYEVRDWYWMCTAGTYTASIMANGDIGACLDIERRPETIQGNVRKDRFRDVWENEFKIFRKDLSDLSSECRACEHSEHCRGDAHHSWDYSQNKPMVCFKDVGLF